MELDIRTQVPNNEWHPMGKTPNGLDFFRKWASLNTKIDINNVVEFCKVGYYEKVLYPNGDELSLREVTYSLADLPRREWWVETTDLDADGKPIKVVEKYMEALPVLTGFINSLGSPYIVQPALQTIQNLELLPYGHEEQLPLKRDTRPLIQGAPPVE